MNTNISMVHNATVVGHDGDMGSSKLMHQLKGTDAMEREQCFQGLNEGRSSVKTEFENHAMSVTPVLTHFESESATFLTPNVSITRRRIP